MIGRILLADDALHIRTIFSKILTNAGHFVKAIDNGDDFFQSVLDLKPDLAIVDLHMPGRELAENMALLRGCEKTKELPVIVITGSDDENELSEVLEAGATDVMLKPPNLNQLLNRVGAYIANARVQAMEQQLERERDSLFLTIARLADCREGDGAFQADRVLHCTELLCRSYEERIAPLPQLREICLAGTLYDVGKVAIPSSIVLKPGALNAQERELMETHCAAGAESLALGAESGLDSDVMELAVGIAESHHERWDGTGYPRGLKGPEIPLAARLISVVGVYDALTSERPYRKALSHEQAQKIILEGKGSQFDPEVVSAFETVAHRFPEIRQRFPH